MISKNLLEQFVGKIFPVNINCMSAYCCVLDIRYKTSTYVENIESHEKRKILGGAKLRGIGVPVSRDFIDPCHYKEKEYKNFPMAEIKITVLDYNGDVIPGSSPDGCWVGFFSFYELIKCNTVVRKDKKKLTYRELLGLTGFKKNVFDTMESLMYNNNHEQNSVA